MIRNLLINAIQIETSHCALLLSGGVDSISVGLAAHYAGKKVHAYSFRLDMHNSYDIQKAEEVAKYMGWEFTPIIVPTDNLEQDWITLANLGCKKKTHFECVFPFLYVYPHIIEKYVVTGWGADGYYGVSKKAQIHYKHTKQKLDQFRDNYYLPKNSAGLLKHLIVTEKYGKVMINPFLDVDVKDFFYSMDWFELNKPYQKHHVRDAFEEFKKIKVKPHLNLQLNSKINVAFETLLNNKRINFKNRKRIMDIARDWNENGTTSLEGFMK